MRIAIAQINTAPGEFMQVVTRMVQQSRTAADQGADLIIFPTSALTGIDPAGMAHSESFPAELSSAIDILARDLACPALVSVQVPFMDPAVPEAILINDGQPMPLRLLAWLEDMGTGAGRGISEGRDHAHVNFELGGVRLAVAMGIESLETLADHPDGSDITIFLQTGSFSIASGIELSGYREIARDLDSWLVAVGGVGGYEAQVLCGGSFCMAPWGEMLAVAPAFEESLLIFEVDVRSEGPLEHPVEIPQLNRARMLWDALVLVTHDYLAKAGIADAVVPLEGDLATSALATLAVDALGPTHVHAVLLDAGPAQRTEDARSLARNLRIDILEEVRPPDNASDAHAKGLLAAAVGTHASSLSALPLGAHDKTYWALECDALAASCALFEPFGDVYRSDVAAMMRRRMTVSPVADPAALTRFDVPNISPKVPGTTPEERLSSIDACLLMLVERGGGHGEVLGEEPGMGEIAEIVLARLADCEIYRRSSAIAPVVSARTLAELAILSGTSWRERISTGASEPPVQEAGLGFGGLGLGYEEGAEVLSRAMEEIARAVADGSRAQGAEGAERVNDVLAILQDLSWQGLQGDDSVFGWGLFSRN